MLELLGWHLSVSGRQLSSSQQASSLLAESPINKDRSRDHPVTVASRAQYPKGKNEVGTPSHARPLLGPWTAPTQMDVPGDQTPRPNLPLSRIRYAHDRRMVNTERRHLIKLRLVLRPDRMQQEAVVICRKPP